MKTTRFTPALLSLFLAFANPVTASETGLTEFGGQSLFSSDFFQRLGAADSSSQPVEALEALYKTLTNPAEKAEVELKLGRVLCSRTNMVDPARSIQWYDKALVRELPLETLPDHLILRGNMHERIGHHREALADYIRGLLICMHFQLPAKWPVEDGSGKLHHPPIDNSIDVNDGRDPGDLHASRQQAADYRVERAMIRREQGLLLSRYYYIEAIKRVQKDAKLSEADLRESCEKLTNRKDRTDELLRLVREPNPRPNP